MRGRHYEAAFANAATWLRMGGDPMELLSTEGVEAMALVRVLELATHQHEKFLGDFYKSIEACVQNGVAKAFTK